MSQDDAKLAALLEVEQAREHRDKAREISERAQNELNEAILAAAELGCSLREIADRAGVSYQRIHRLIRRTNNQG